MVQSGGSSLTASALGATLIARELAADMRTDLALGSIATLSTSAVAFTGGTSTGVANGARTTSAGTDTLVLADAGGAVVFGASCTVTITAGLPAGSPIRLAASAAATLTWALSGGESISEATTALTAGQGRLLIKESALVWRVVQSGSVSTTGARIYQSGGVLYAVGQGIGAGGRVDVGAPVALTAVAGGGKVTQTGTDIVLASGAVAAATPAPDVIGAEGQCWWVALSALGVTAPSFGDRVTSLIRMTTRPTVDRAYVGCALLSGEWATSAETVFTAALGYGPSNKLAKWSGGTSTFSTATAAAGIDLLTVQMGARLDKALVQYTNAAKTASTSVSTTIAPSTAAPTHLGFFCCAAGGTTGSAATFGDVIAYFDFTAAP